MERHIESHDRVQAILSRYPGRSPIYIDSYGEVFNKKNQNFRIQKSFPNLILAYKNTGYILEVPEANVCRTTETKTRDINPVGGRRGAMF